MPFATRNFPTAYNNNNISSDNVEQWRINILFDQIVRDTDRGHQANPLIGTPILLYDYYFLNLIW